LIAAKTRSRELMGSVIVRPPDDDSTNEQPGPAARTAARGSVTRDTLAVVRAPAIPAPDIRPRLSLGLLAVQHALIHGQSALYPLVYLAVIDEFGVTPATIVILSTIGSITSGFLQYSFGALTPFIGRPTLLGGGGGLVVGIRTAAQAAASAFRAVRGREHRQRSEARRSTRSGTPCSPSSSRTTDQDGDRGARRRRERQDGRGRLLGGARHRRPRLARCRGRARRPVLLVAVTILVLVRGACGSGSGASDGPVRSLYRAVLADRDLRWLYLAAVLGGGSRGLGILNIFVPLYLDQVIGLGAATIGLMYGVLLAASVPGPLVAGWLSDRAGRKPVIVGVYLAGGRVARLFVMAGSDTTLLWIGVALLSLFSFVESPQLQALLADVTPRHLRDAAFSTYFALAFGVGSMWGIVYGAVIGTCGQGSGLGTGSADGRSVGGGGRSDDADPAPHRSTPFRRPDGSSGGAKLDPAGPAVGREGRLLVDRRVPPGRERDQPAETGRRARPGGRRAVALAHLLVADVEREPERRVAASSHRA
jgi:MFS family permease